MLFHHTAIIVSSEKGVDFYKDLGFVETERQFREKDQLIWMKGNNCTLELFLDNSHPQHNSNPETNGLKHIAFETEHLEAKREELSKYNPEPIKEKYRIFFVNDPDGQPIEIREYLPKAPEGSFSFEG